MTRRGGRLRAPEDTSDQVGRPSRERPTLPRRARRAALIVLLLAIAYGGLCWFSGRALGPLATAGGIDLGGLTETQARARLAERATAVVARPIPLLLGGTQTELIPSSSGLSVDVDATMRQLLGFTLDPVRVYHRLRGGDAVPLRGRADEPALQAAVAAAARAVDRPVKEGSVIFPGGTVVAQRPAAGRRVDVAATARAVLQRWPEEGVVTGVVEEVRPRLDPAAFDAAVGGPAAAAVAEPLTVLADGRQAVLTPTQLSPALAMVPDGDALALRVDARALLTALRRVAPGLEIQPVNATLKVRDGTPTLVPATTGRLIEPVASAEAVAAALGAGRHTATLALADAAPAVSGDQVAGYGITAELGRATVGLAGAGEAARLSNAALTASKLDGTVLAPGGSFSFNEVVGARTPAAGFRVTTTQLPGISGQDEGGVGVVASAVYEAAFRAGLTLGPRTPYAAYLPGTSAGLDARATTGGPDVIFTADPSHGVLVSAQVRDGRVEVILYGRSGASVAVTAAAPANLRRPEPVLQDGGACRARPSQPGFDITISRVVSHDGVTVRRDAVSAAYAPVPGVTCG